MSIANISSPEDSYGRSGNLLPPERPTPAINQNFQEGGISFGNYMNQNGENFQQREVENNMMSRSLMPSAGMGVNSLMPSAGMGVNSLMLSAGINSQEEEFSDSYGRSGNLLPPERPTPAINQNFQEGDISFGNYMNKNGENFQQREIENNMMSRSLMPSAGMGVNSLIPVPSAGIGVNSLMPSAGIGVNSLMLSAGMNSQEKELSGDLFFWPSTNSTGFGNPDPPMMGMSHLENPFKDIGDSSHYGITTPATNRNFQNGENEELLNHNQTNNSRIGMKRHFEELDKSKAKKKGTEEQYNSQQSPMRKNKKFTKEELVEKKTGPQIRLLYRHRIDRQIAQDKETDMKSVLVKPWPMQPDVQGIQQEFHEIVNANLEPEEDKERSLEVASKFDILQQQRKEHSTTAGNRDLLDYIVNHLGLYFQDSFLEKLKEQFSARSPSLLSAFYGLKHRVYDKGNNKVGKESFPGLQEELQKIGWEEVPSFLQSIVSRIEKDRGIVTDFTYKPTQILVCAAIKEMEDFPVEKLDLDTLTKWGATLNKAKELGFQVGFADDLLKKNCFAYLACTQVSG